MADSKKQDDRVVAWLKELRDARKREENYRKEAADLVKLYEGEEGSKNQFNILYSNTETLSPALYNSTPRPEVKRRYNDPDPLAKAACDVVKRLLAYQLDDNISEYASFDTLMGATVLGALVPGRGIIRFDYEAEVEEAGTEEAGAGTVEGVEAEEAPMAPRVVKEEIVRTLVSWDRFLHGYGKTWEEVPWIAYHLFMTKEEAKEYYPDTYMKLEAVEIKEDDEKYASLEDSQKGVKLIEVYQIWDKTSRTVFDLNPQYVEGFLRDPKPDPYGLSGFFNCVQPLQLFDTISGLTPVPLYRLYKAQAEELNSVTVRIGKIMRAMKVRGFYDSNIEGLQKIFEVDDNTMLPMENVAALYGNGTGGLDKALLFLPIEQLVGVLNQLLGHRQQIKQVIYEITGIADIMRGVSQASETLGAQELKNQWGTLRLKRIQRRVALYVRQNLRLMAELMISQLSEQTIEQMTGLAYPTMEEKVQAQTLIAQLQALGKQPDPQIAQTLTQPSWDELLGMLRDDEQRTFRVDIESNSTLDAEATEDKADMQEVLAAVGQFFASVGPQVEAGVLPFEVAKSMLMAVVRRYRLGPDIEEELLKLQQPQPKSDPAADLKKLELQARQEEMKHEAAMREQDMQLRTAEHGFKMQEMQQKAELTAAQHRMAMQKMVLQAAMPQGPANGESGQ